MKKPKPLVQGGVDVQSAAAEATEAKAEAKAEAVAAALRIFCSYDPAVPQYWRLEAPYTRRTSIGDITVPEGFVWDGASVPRHFWAILPPWGPYSGAALVHDYLCDTRPTKISSATAHMIFYKLMKEDGVPPNDAWLMYTAVMKFGPQWSVSPKT